MLNAIVFLNENGDFYLNPYVGPSDVISLAVSDVRPLKKFIYLSVLSLGVLLSEFVVLHLPEMPDETP